MLHAVDAEYTARFCNLWPEETLNDETYWIESWLNLLNTTQTVLVWRLTRKPYNFNFLLFIWIARQTSYDIWKWICMVFVSIWFCVERHNLKKNTTEFSVSKYCLILEGRVVVAIYRLYWSLWNKNRFLQGYRKQWIQISKLNLWNFSWLNSSLDFKSIRWCIDKQNLL